MNYSQHENIPFEDMSYPVRMLRDITLTEEDTKTLPMKWHEEIELLYFYDGGAAAQIGDRLYIAEAGDLLIVNPLQIHDVYYYSGTPRYDCVMIDKSVYISTLNELCTAKYGSPMLDHDVHFNNVVHPDDELDRVLDAFLSECRVKGFASNELGRNLIQCVFILLFRTEVQGMWKIRESKLAVSRYRRLEAVFKYIDDNYAAKISTETLAKLCSVTPTHFCKLFRDATGKTASEYICEQRLTKAKTLLETTSLPVAEIAALTGFEDNCYFSRRFKRFYGVSPTNLR